MGVSSVTNGILLRRVRTFLLVGGRPCLTPIIRAAGGGTDCSVQQELLSGEVASGHVYMRIVFIHQ